jgi:hypothetical protein
VGSKVLQLSQKRQGIAFSGHSKLIDEITIGIKYPEQG